MAFDEKLLGMDMLQREINYQDYYHMTMKGYKPMFEIVTKVETLYNNVEGWAVQNHDKDYGFKAVTFSPSGCGEYTEARYDDYEDAKDYAFGACALCGCMAGVFVHVDGRRYTLAEYHPVYHYARDVEENR